VTSTLLVENPLGRCMLGSRSELAWNDDGSLTLAIKRDTDRALSGMNAARPAVQLC
jgi:hypothetical protein